MWTDLAVLEIDSEAVSATAEFGDSENLTVGEPAIAIGSPLGTNFASSVTSGIISATGRTVPVDTNMDGENDWEMTAIQTDAAINPGNSGGPLVNIAGQVVGINSMKISSSTIEGMGFAIPSNDALDIINQLEQDGEVIRPVIGVAMVDLSMVSPQQQEAILNLPEDVTGGVVIAEVQPNSSADEAGLESNDVIVSFNGEEVANGIELRQEIYDTEIGDEVEIEFYRDGELQSVTLTLQSTEEQNI
jgi:serine protease Do